MILKKKLTSQYAAFIFSDYVILTVLLDNIYILKLLPNISMKIPFIMALIFIAWIFIK